jgi:extradiol dioxygenase family protein
LLLLPQESKMMRWRRHHRFFAESGKRLTGEPMRFSLSLAVTDLQQTENFYRDILQLSPRRGQTRAGLADFLLLHCRQTCIVFRPLADLEASHPALLQNLARHPLGVGVQLEFSCADLSGIVRNLKQQHWPVKYELEDDEHQRRELWLHDPDGYLLVLNEEEF